MPSPGKLGVAADPAAVLDVQVAIDALVGPKVMPYRRAVLGYREVRRELNSAVVDVLR
jgi:hypothetical protein